MMCEIPLYPSLDRYLQSADKPLVDRDIATCISNCFLCVARLAPHNSVGACVLGAARKGGVAKFTLDGASQ